MILTIIVGITAFIFGIVIGLGIMNTIWEFDKHQKFMDDMKQRRSNNYVTINENDPLAHIGVRNKGTIRVWPTECHRCGRPSKEPLCKQCLSKGQTT